MIDMKNIKSDGEAYESNTSEGIWTAGIDFPHPRLTTWHSRIECHGESKKEAEELRDATLAALRPEPTSGS